MTDQLAEAMARAEAAEHQIKRLKAERDSSHFGKREARVAQGQAELRAEAAERELAEMRKLYEFAKGFRGAERKTRLEYHQRAETAEIRLAEVEHLLWTILDAEQHFRNALPDEWDGDPIHDACEAARVALDRAPAEGKP